MTRVSMLFGVLVGAAEGWGNEKEGASTMEVLHSECVWGCAVGLLAGWDMVSSADAKEVVLPGLTVASAAKV